MWEKHLIYKPYTSLYNLFRLCLFLLVLCSSTNSFGQEKKTKIIHLRRANITRSGGTIAPDAKRLLGNVMLESDNKVISCDSAWLYETSRTFIAYGQVHIVSNDTLQLWCKHLYYDAGNAFAKARNKVKLQDPSLTLTTDSLDFDLEKDIAYYKYGGKIVDSTNTLNSRTGTYYTNLSEVHFIDNVRLMNDEYKLRTDTLFYYTETEVAKFKGPTTIIGDSTHIYSNGGWFNTLTNESELTSNSTIKRGETQLQADHIYFNDETGDGNAEGNVIINDYQNQMIIAGEKAFYSDFNRHAVVTDSALWIQYYEADSLFLHADTLYTMPDTSAQNAKLLITYNAVRFYRNDIQGLCDSLIYFTRDSTIQLYKDPVIWASENQMSADFIEMKNNATPPNEVYLTSNSFIIQQVDSSKFNQIKGRNMIGLIDGKLLYRIDVNGNGQSIYYPADEKDYVGINRAESSNIILYLTDNQIKRITFVGTPSGKMNPLLDIVSPDSKLDGFNWRESERPVSRYDIFGDIDLEEQPSTLPDNSIKNILPDIETARKIMQESRNFTEYEDSLNSIKNTIMPLIDSLQQQTPFFK